MELFNKVQKNFLDEIRGKLPKNVSFAEILAEDLNISNDSAYRRIRGDTYLSIEECMVLCAKYNVSLDSFFMNDSKYVIFNHRAINSESFNFESYFNSILVNLEAVKRFEVKEVIYAAKDMPPYHLLMFESLAAFKLFFWMSNIYCFPQYQNQVFDLEIFSKNLLGLSKQVWESYISIPSTEIWSEETINTTLRQIEFMYDCGRFKSIEDALRLYEDLREVIEHMHKQAKKGFKYLYGKENAIGDEKNFQLYYNEIVIVDNTVSFKMGDTQMIMLGNNIINILATTDPVFCQQTNDILKNIMRNSTLISVVAEKVRNRFFLTLKNKIDAYINRIKNNVRIQTDTK
jgi:hypothetical protein